MPPKGRLIMLQLTENATTIVRSIAEQSQNAGLRLSSTTQPDAPYSVALVPEAQADDQVVEQDGAVVYLDQSAAAQLDDKVLDAGLDASGNVEFGLSQQGSAQA